MEYTWQHEAYLKVAFHAAKYLASPLTGLLLGQEDKTNQKISIIDSIPLFHTPLLAPMTELALLQVDLYAAQSDLKIVGIYTAQSVTSEKPISEFTVDSAIQKVANKMRQYFDNAFVFIIDNDTVTNSQSEVPAGRILTASGSGGVWKLNTQQKMNESEKLKKVLATHFASKTYLNLADFEQHLDDVSQDYTNTNLFTSSKRD